ncbi:hypothetical protein WJX72_003584 [[Myrmecia] bisecta]|uniref:Succinate dehydrogenase [ubiquinone] cytochrome b small subunit n=1 Tax=[Myrmecia] bisecta TaxID=41462 RepID=A0AAW1PJR2_9CHLO
MSALQKVLRADSAGAAAQKLYENTHIALAGLVPLAVLSGEGNVGKATDVALGVLIPLHSHVAINSVLSDYVPKSVLGVSRWGALAVTGVTLLGFMKLNLAGPGLTHTVKELWRK